MTKKEAKRIAIEGIANSEIDWIFDAIDVQMPVGYTDRDLDKVSVALKEIIQKWIEKKQIENKMTNEQEAAAWDKASELATAATKAYVSTYWEVRQACIDAIKWQHEQDKLMLDAKDESVIQMDMSQFEILQQACKYREFLAGSFKCGEKRNFCGECNKKNCPMIK